MLLTVPITNFGSGTRCRRSRYNPMKKSSNGYIVKDVEQSMVNLACCAYGT